VRKRFRLKGDLKNQQRLNPQWSSLNLLSINWLTKWLDPSSVLDIGWYVGWNSAFFKAPQDRYAIGVDLDIRWLYKAHALLDDAVRADVRHLPFKESSFDASICIEVIEHLAKEDGTILNKDAKRVLKSLILTTPNGWHGSGWARDIDHRELMDHRSHYTSKDLQLLGARRVRGLGWRNTRGSIRKYSYFFWMIPYRFPRYSSNLMALF